MKRLCFQAVLLALLTAGLIGCASTQEVASDSPVKSSGTVPGEKTSEESMSATAGPGVAGAGMRW